MNISNSPLALSIDLRWDSTIDRLEFKYGLRLDEFKKLKGSKGGKCNEGRGWYGLKGACKRGKKKDDNTAKIKASKVELADKIRAKKGLRDRNAPTIEQPIPSTRTKAKAVRTKANPDNVENKGRLGPSISPKNVIGTDKRFTSESINNALDQIQSEGAAERLSNIRSIIEAQGIQSVFRGKGATSSSHTKLAEEIEHKGEVYKATKRSIEKLASQLSEMGENPDKYLLKKLKKMQRSIYEDLVGDRVGVGGYTSKDLRHVVVLAGTRSSYSSFNVKPKEIQDMADATLSPMRNTPLTVASTGKDAAFDLATYLHEVGHQIQWISEAEDSSLATKAPRDKPVTRYGMTNNMENFAEGFTLWTLDAKGLKAKNPEMHDYIQESVAAAMKADRRLE